MNLKAVRIELKANDRSNDELGKKSLKRENI